MASERHAVNLDYWAHELRDGDHPLIEAVRALRAENTRLQSELEARLAHVTNQMSAASDKRNEWWHAAISAEARVRDLRQAMEAASARMSTYSPARTVLMEALTVTETIRERGWTPRDSADAIRYLTLAIEQSGHGEFCPLDVRGIGRELYRCDCWKADAAPLLDKWKKAIGWPEAKAGSR